MLSSTCTTFNFVEGRLRLNNKNKKVFLFCIVFDLHYLCTEMIRRKVHTIVLLAVFAVMLAIMMGMIGTAIYYESQPTPALVGLPVEQTMNLEGKELRFGSTAAAVFAAVTTSATTGWEKA